MPEREDVESLARVLSEHRVRIDDRAEWYCTCGAMIGRAGQEGGIEAIRAASELHRADAALSWFRARQTVETAEELDALPVGSVVLDLGPSMSERTAPVVACKAARGDWQVLGDDPERRWWSSEVADVARPNVLRVLYRPDERGEGEHVHSWADVTELADEERRHLCTGCGATKNEGRVGE